MEKGAGSEEEENEEEKGMVGVGSGGVTSIKGPNCEALMMIKLSYC